jgi:methionine synthase II (cobalamin-independent)
MVTVTYCKTKMHYVLKRNDGTVIILQENEASAVFYAFEMESRRQELFERLENTRNADGTYMVGKIQSVKLSETEIAELVEASLDDFSKKTDGSDGWPDCADEALEQAFETMKGAA